MRCASITETDRQTDDIPQTTFYYSWKLKTSKLLKILKPYLYFSAITIYVISLLFGIQEHIMVYRTKIGFVSRYPSQDQWYVK
jgi:hypothetical protein